MGVPQSGSVSRRRESVPFGSNSEFLEGYQEVLVALLQKNREVEKIQEEDSEADDGSYRKSKPKETPLTTHVGLEDAVSRYDRKRRAFESRVEATLKAGSPKLPLRALTTDLSLSPIEEMILITVLTYNSSREFERLLDRATHTSYSCVKTFVRLFGDSPESRQLVRSMFLQTGSLMRNNLLQHMHWERLSEENFLCHRLEVPLSASNIVFDHHDDPASDSECVSIQQPRCAFPDLLLPERTKSELRGAIYSSLVILHGSSGSGKTSVAHAMAAELGFPLQIVRTTDFLRGPCDSRSDIVAVLKHARINRAVVLFEGAERLLDDDPYDRMIEDFCEEFEAYPGLVVVTTRSAPAGSGPMVQQADHVIELGVPDSEQREELWSRFLPQTDRLAPDVDFHALAVGNACTGGRIRQIAARALKRASMRPRGQQLVTMADLTVHDSTRPDRMNPDSPTGVITPGVTLEDVVLPDELRDHVEEIVKACASRTTVLEKWGFGNAYSTGHGLAALFYGESGTGKTLTAEAIAGELGRPLRMIQLSGILNKYVGETEKRIVDVFRAAASGSEVLLADEADALFTSRISASEHNAYYINNHINCLLAEMDRFTGIVILSSNRPLALDPAFERRIGWKLEFPKPDPKLRESLWRMLIPASAPVSADVDFSELASKFDYTGGLIRQVLLKAAYSAAADGVPISRGHIIRAAATGRVREGKKRRKSSGIGFQASA